AEGSQVARASCVYPWSTEIVRLDLEEGGTIRVRVVDLDGKPVEKAGVHCGEDKWGLTDALGIATFARLVPGPSWVEISEHSDSRRDVDVGPGETVEVELVLAVPLELPIVAGRVFDEHGNGLARVEVWCRCGPDWAVATTEGDGRFTARAAPNDAASVHVM